MDNHEILLAFFVSYLMGSYIVGFQAYAIGEPEMTLLECFLWLFSPITIPMICLLVLARIIADLLEG